MPSHERSTPFNQLHHFLAALLFWFNPLLVLKNNERCVAYGYTATKLADE